MFKALVVSADRQKKDRSPSYPFISLRRAVERSQEFLLAHKRDAARLATVAPTWGYGTKSSGLLQTVAALKQYGLLEDLGSGDERKIKLSDLARRIISDTRPGIKEEALQAAANNPKLFSEYISRWVPDIPADSHCLSELEHDRGFTPEAAKLFLKSFKITVSYAGLLAKDSVSFGSDSSPETEESLEVEHAAFIAPPALRVVEETRAAPPLSPPSQEPFRVSFTGKGIEIIAKIRSAKDADELVSAINALKLLLRPSGDDRVFPTEISDLEDEQRSE
jgi:hypothetical protein